MATTDPSEPFVAQGTIAGRAYMIISSSNYAIRLWHPPGGQHTDEVCASAVAGLINISLLIRKISEGKITPPIVEFPIDAHWHEVAWGGPIPAERMALLTAEEVRRRPVLLLETANAGNVLIDGRRRLRWMCNQNWPTAQGFLFTAEQLKPFTLRMTISEDGGRTWVDGNSVVSCGLLAMWEQGATPWLGGSNAGIGRETA